MQTNKTQFTSSRYLASVFGHNNAIIKITNILLTVLFVSTCFSVEYCSFQWRWTVCKTGVYLTFPSLPSPGTQPLNPTIECGEHCKLPAGLGEPNHHTLYMVQFELKITKRLRVTSGILKLNCMQTSKSSIWITDNLVKSWGVLPLWDTPWPNLIVSGHQDAPGSQPMVHFQFGRNFPQFRPGDNFCHIGNSSFVWTTY